MEFLSKNKNFATENNKKPNRNFIFKKNHEGKKEIFLDDYLKRFMEENFDINNLLEKL